MSGRWPTWPPPSFRGVDSGSGRWNALGNGARFLVDKYSHTLPPYLDYLNKLTQERAQAKAAGAPAASLTES